MILFYKDTNNDTNKDINKDNVYSLYIDKLLKVLYKITI
jgi:hypothetical protein